MSSSALIEDRRWQQLLVTGGFFLLFSACGGIAEQNAAPTSRDATDDDSLTAEHTGEIALPPVAPDSPPPDNLDGEGVLFPAPGEECGCTAGHYGVTVQGPDGTVLYDLPPPKEVQVNVCGVPSLQTSACHVGLSVTACHASKGCIVVGRSSTDVAVLEFWSADFSSLKSLSGDNDFVALEELEDPAVGFFSFESDGKPLYSGSFSACMLPPTGCK